MRLPTLNEMRTSKDIVDIFRGYNHNLRINDGEFYDMKNLSSSEYPVLSPRHTRGLFASPTSPQGLISKDSLGYVDGQYFILNEQRIDMGLSTLTADCPKQLVSMGAYVIIMPDKKYINTKDLNDYGNIEASTTTSTAVTFSLSTRDSSAYDITYKQPQEPKGTAENPIPNGSFWLDISSTPNVLKQWSESSGMWTQIATTYVKISCTGIGSNFKQFDAVSISGIKGVVLKDTDGTAIQDTGGVGNIDGSYVIWDRGDDFITIVGVISASITISNPITIARKMPNLDFVIESENRLWGCHYGVATNGEVVNEIYASKLGDFKNWYCYMGISTDSYAATVGTDGQFTGAITHLGYPIFFKENCMHKIYGNQPANYQIQTTVCRGVAKGSENSLAIVNETLYYKSRTGICAYDGSLPSEISYAFGEEQYTDAVAGSNGNKYYISMKDSADSYHMFVFDASKGLWHREDNTRADAFCSCRGEMYYIDHESGNIMSCLGTGLPEIDPIEWMAESGVIGTDGNFSGAKSALTGKKYISQLLVRMSLAVGTKVMFSIQYDSCGKWEHLFTMTGTHLRSFTVPVRPKRCDHFRIRIEGIGTARIYSITKTIEQGSDL